MIITPVFLSSGSGAATYYKLLAKELYKKSYDITVISDKEIPDSDDHLLKKINIKSLFPNRCLREKNKIKDVFLYLMQNLLFFKIFWYLHKIKPNKVLIHSSFYNHPGLFMCATIIFFKFFKRINFYVDVRDNLFPNKKIGFLKRFKKVSVCSKNIYNNLKSNGIGINKLFYIPIISTVSKPTQNNIKSYLKQNNLIKNKYLLYVGLIKESKNTDLLLRSFINFIHRKTNFCLVLAGLDKFHKTANKLLLKHKAIIYLGNQNHNNVMMLMSAATLCINISPNEGLPRASLEAISLNRKVLLPPNIAEFDLYSNSFVLKPDATESDIANKILTLISTNNIQNYPIEMHKPQNVIPMYDLFFGYRND